MADPSVIEHYRKLAGEMADRIAAVPEDRWGSPSPCEGWTARDIVGHLVDTPGMFFGLVDQPPPSGGPAVADDPAGAFAHARGAVEAALEDPAIADKQYDGFLGQATFAEGIDRFICADLVVHGWDLARAAGLDDTIDPGEARHLMASLGPMDDKMRGPGAFGAKIEPPPGADEQTKLLCFLGRQP